jgi:threonine/homoserine/homoserine lactone efflux protein
MTTDQAIAFVLFAVVAAITPGPSNVILASMGANAGVRRGLPCLIGTAAGMGFMMFVVTFGLGTLILESPALLQALKWGGIGFLLWLAWKIATATHGPEANDGTIIGFWGASAFQWINPKSWLIAASAAGAYLPAGTANALAPSAALGLLFVLAALPSCFVWLAFGASAQRLLRSERELRAFNLTMATLLAGSILLIVR